MDPKTCGGGKRLPKIAASLIMRFASEREPGFIVQRASLKPPLTSPGPEFPYSSLGPKSKSLDFLRSAPSDMSSLESARSRTQISPTFKEGDSDSDEECLSLKSLNSPSEGDDFLPGQGDTAESSPKRGKRTGGELDLSLLHNFKKLYLKSIYIYIRFADTWPWHPYWAMMFMCPETFCLINVHSLGTLLEKSSHLCNYLIVWQQCIKFYRCAPAALGDVHVNHRNRGKFRFP